MSSLNKLILLYFHADILIIHINLFFSHSSATIAKFFDNDIQKSKPENNNTVSTNDEVEMISRDSPSSDFGHTRQVFAPVKFEGLPNFICYQEEDVAL